MANIHVLKENMSFVLADKFTRIHTHQMGVSRHKLDTLYDARADNYVSKTEVRVCAVDI